MQVLPVLLEIQNGIWAHGEVVLEDYWDANMKRLREKDGKLYEQMSRCEQLHQCSPYRDDIYSIEDSSVGDLTVAVTAGEERIYLHSNENPMGYSETLADEYYDAHRDDYVVYGLGLGYHCRHLAEKDEDLQITVLENDIGMIELAMTYTDMSWYFNHPGVRIVYDADWSEFTNVVGKEEQPVVIFHHPSVNRIKDNQIKNQIRKLMVREGSARARGNRMIRNFLYNKDHCNMDITSVKQDIQGKTVVIVAAGPSLDQNVHLLKERRDNVIILALGAVYRKLAGMGIPMDYVIITDPKEVSDHQIAGLEESDIPMLLLSTATKGVARMYQGQKYLLCQRGFEDAEQLAREEKLELFETGGSVATTAVDVCIRLGAGRIVFAGLDLAYTGNRDHTSGARQEGITNYDELIMIEDVYGNPVPSTTPFIMYREWIERRIAKDDVTMPVIDATEGGAKIKGTEIRKLEEVLLYAKL
jgi:hypothetical protein